MINMYMKKYTSVLIREIKIEMKMSCHLIPDRITRMKNTREKCWQGCRDKVILLHCCWDCELVQPL